MLTKAGYPCRLVTYVENQFYEPYLVQNNVEYELVTDFRDRARRVFRVSKYVNKYNPDIVISYLPSVNMTMCLVKLFTRAKLIVSERNNNTSLTLKDRLLFNLYRLADIIVPNSNSQALFISNHFRFLSRKVHPVINFVDINRFVAANRLHDNGCLRIVIVARYTSQKNVLRFLDVVRKAKDKRLNVHFAWFGNKDYDKEYFCAVCEKYRLLGVEDYITLNGPCVNIEKEYNNADALCLPSLFEGYPNAIVEAMASSLPVICADRFENPYIIEDNINGFLFDPEDIDDIFSAIVKLTKLSDEERKRMGQLNRELCKMRNAQEVFLQSYVKLIEDLE